MKRVLMAFLALILFAIPASSQALPRGDARLDSLSREFQTRFAAIVEANPKMDDRAFRRMTPETPFIDDRGQRQYLELGEFQGVWGWVFRQVYGEDYLSYRETHRQHFTQTGGTPEMIRVDLSGDGQDTTQFNAWDLPWWAITLIMLAIIMALIIGMLMRTISAMETDANKREVEMARRADDLMKTLRMIESSLATEKSRSAKLDEEVSFYTALPPRILREGDPIFEHLSLEDSKEHSLSQVANILDRLVRAHFGALSFVDHSTIQGGTMNGPGVLVVGQEYTPSQLEVVFEKVHGYRFQMYYGYDRNIVAKDLYVSSCGFSLCMGWDGEGFTFTPDTSELTNAELVEQAAEGPSGLLEDDRVPALHLAGTEEMPPALH